MQTNDLTTPLSYDAFNEIDVVLREHEHDEGMLCASEFDGFITAVVSTPKDDHAFCLV